MQDIIDEYMEAIFRVCSAYKHLYQIEQNHVDQESKSFAVLYFSNRVENLEKIKSECGYGSGIDFLTMDIPFQGFEIKNGILTGNIERAIEKGKEWFNNFLEDYEDNFRFEIACLIITLTADLESEEKTDEKCA